MRKHTQDTREQWHTWFAWYPIWVNLQSRKGVWIWWEKVQRKQVSCYEGIMTHIRNLDGTDL